MKIYAHKDGGFDRYALFGCDDETEVQQLTAEVFRAFVLAPEATVVEVSKQSYIYNELLAYFRENGTGYIAKMLSSDDVDLVIGGHKYARFHKFVSRQKKIDQLLDSNDN